MIDRKPPPPVPFTPVGRERSTFRDVSVEMVNRSRSQRLRFVDYYGRLDRPTIEVGPGESAVLADQWYRCHTSDGLPPEKLFHNYGTAKSKKARGRR